MPPKRHPRPRPTKRSDFSSTQPDEKDIMRIRDMIKKAGSNPNKIVALTETMAGRITDKYKALRRAIAADIIAREALADLELELFISLIKASDIFKYKARHIGNINVDEYHKFCSADDADSNNKDSVNDLII